MIKEKIDNEFKQFINMVNETKKDVAREAFRSVVEKSPVKTGSYVSSHRIGIRKSAATIEGGPGRPFGTTLLNQGEDFRGMTAGEFRQAKANALKNMSAVNRARPGDIIVIGNNIHYADQVEYIGWHGRTKSTPPYHVYGRTWAEMEVKMPFIVKRKRIL